MSSIAFQQIGLSEPPSNKARKWLRRFILSAGCILLITGLAKVISAFGTAKILEYNDPLFGISFKHLIPDFPYKLHKPMLLIYNKAA
jgi:hypothetical protein